MAAAGKLLHMMVIMLRLLLVIVVLGRPVKYVYALWEP
jgi:uncharacterized membrane protein (DUF4010 family)